MLEPVAYSKSHKSVKNFAARTVKDHFAKVQWGSEKCQTFMDIGTGSGDVLMQSIYPLIEDKFEKFICADISPAMLEFVEKHYGTNKKLECRLLDIAAPVGVPSELKETIDHFTSIYVLNMIKDFSACTKNMFDLLRPDGGECLLVFMTKNTIVEAYDALSLSPKWFEYKQIIRDFLPPLYNCEDPKSNFENLMKTSGFKDVSVEATNEVFSYESLEYFRESIKTVCLPAKSMPTLALRNEFVDDVLETIMALMSTSANLSKIKSQYALSCIMLVCRAKK